MLVHQAFRYELAPTAAQRASLTNHAGAARWAWNWGLSVRRKAFTRRRQTMNAMDLHRLLNRLKRTPRYGWLYEVSKCAPQEALRDLDRAYANAWRGRKSGRRIGLPRWKKRGRCPERFRLTGAIRVQDGAVVLPRIGRVATKEPTGKFYGRILSATCRQQADRWYCSLTVQVDRPDPAPVEGPVVGVDRGITRFAVCSDGTGINNPRALECSLRKLRRRARAVSRNRHLARAISDRGWAEFHRQLSYKTQWYGSRLLVAPRFYPSSKTCSGCGLVTSDLPLSVRTFRCQACRLVVDRDLNAARNLEGLARLTAGDAGLVAASSAETRNACGEGSAGRANIGPVELPSAKQERTASRHSQMHRFR